MDGSICPREGCSVACRCITRTNQHQHVASTGRRSIVQTICRNTCDTALVTDHHHHHHNNNIQLHHCQRSPSVISTHQWEVLWNATTSTQHLDHLSTALHLLPPLMKTFQVKHRAYKFQVAITIVYQKAVDPSVVTQPPVTRTSEMIAVDFYFIFIYSLFIVGYNNNNNNNKKS